MTHVAHSMGWASVSPLNHSDFFLDSNHFWPLSIAQSHDQGLSSNRSSCEQNLLSNRTYHYIIKMRYIVYTLNWCVLFLCRIHTSNKQGCGVSTWNLQLLTSQFKVTQTQAYTGWESFYRNDWDQELFKFPSIKWDSLGIVLKSKHNIYGFHNTAYSKHPGKISAKVNFDYIIRLGSGLLLCSRYFDSFYSEPVSIYIYPECSFL